MGIQQIYPAVRTEIVDRLHHVAIPFVAGSQALSVAPLGATPFPDSSSASIPYSTATPLIGGTAGQLIMLKAGTNIGAKLLEKSLSDLQLGTDTTYTASLYVRSPVGGPNPRLFINGSGVVGDNFSAAATTKDAWTRISVTFKTKTTTGLISVYLFFDSSGFVNAYTLFDALQIDDGGAAVPFFCGDGPLQPDATFMYKWIGTRYNSLSARFTYDPSEVHRPSLVEGWEGSKRVGRIVHRTLNNELVIVERQNTFSIGRITTIWNDRASAYRFYSFLDRAGIFKYEDFDNPENNLQFVATETITITQSPLRRKWIVAFQFEQTS